MEAFFSPLFLTVCLHEKSNGPSNKSIKVPIFLMFIIVAVIMYNVMLAFTQSMNLMSYSV